MSDKTIFISQLLNDGELKEVIARTGCGLELVDFSMAGILDNLPVHLELWKRRLESIKPARLSVHGAFLDLNPTSWERLVADATMLRFNQSYMAAKVLGADRIIFHSCFVPNFNFLIGWAPRVIDFYERFLEDKDDSIQVLMENVMDPVPDSFAEVAEGIRHPAFGICLDIGHAHCYSNASVSEWLTSLSPRIRHLHIHDNDGTRDAHLALGDGTILSKGIVKSEEIEESGRPDWSGRSDCSGRSNEGEESDRFTGLSEHKQSDGFTAFAELIPESAGFTIECSRKEDVIKSMKMLSALK